jgi:hypothetical protein
MEHYHDNEEDFRCLDVGSAKHGIPMFRREGLELCVAEVLEGDRGGNKQVAD